jgi:signal recognition particle receptor subunit beta
MGSAHSDDQGVGTGGNAPADQVLIAHKILVAGGFGAGKTTLVGAISEVRPLLTEEVLSTASVGRDNLTGLPAKTTTTVALDFGRITLTANLVLYLFGVPGQERFWFMWDELAYGALGAVVLADVRRLRDCFPSVNYFEQRRLPFIVAVNCFDDAPKYDAEEIRQALDLDREVPLVLCDARSLASVKKVLIALVESIFISQAGTDHAPGRRVAALGH